MRVAALSFVVLSLIAAAPTSAQTRPDPSALLAAQRTALAPLAALMHGVWRGQAWTITPGGRHEVTQTERIGPFLGGSVLAIEGRGYNADGSVGFNALGIVSFNPATSAYTLSSWAQGFSGVFPFRPTANGYVWEVPAGPGAIIRYTATIDGDAFREVGERIAGDGPRMQMFEMNLRRVSDTDWPAAGAVPMR